MKYTKKQREEAILICAIAASGGVPFGVVGQRGYNIIQNEIDAASEALTLAIEAWSLLRDVYPAWPPEHDAEAAQMLRDGWSPGDPVEVRNGR